MKIVEVVPTLNIGGAEKFAVNLSDQLVKSGCDCTLLTLYDQEQTQPRVSVPSSSIIMKSLGKNRGVDFMCLLRLMHFVIKEKPAVVHAHIGAITYLLLAAIFCRKTRYVATIHSEASREAGSFLHRLVRKFMFKLKLVLPVTISEESRKSFIDFYKLHPAMIYNGIPDFDGKCECEDLPFKKIFVHVASCQPVKNQELLLKSFSSLIAKYPDVELHWYGSYASYPELFDELSSYFSPQITYKGVISDVRTVLNNAVAVCLSSRMEGLPMSLIEAMSVRCIPVATPVGGCKDLISNGVNGFLSADQTPESYTEMLEKIINISKVQRDKMRSECRRLYETKYSIETCTDLYLNLFEK